jgi:hypothetical protein
MMHKSFFGLHIHFSGGADLFGLRKHFMKREPFWFGQTFSGKRKPCWFAQTFFYVREAFSFYLMCKPCKAALTLLDEQTFFYAAQT